MVAHVCAFCDMTLLLGRYLLLNYRVNDLINIILLLQLSLLNLEIVDLMELVPHVQLVLINANKTNTIVIGLGTYERLLEH